VKAPEQFRVFIGLGSNVLADVLLERPYRDSQLFRFTLLSGELSGANDHNAVHELSPSCN